MTNKTRFKQTMINGMNLIETVVDFNRAWAADLSD